MSELKYCITFDGFTPEIFKQYVELREQIILGKIVLRYYENNHSYDFPQRFLEDEVFDDFDAAKTALKKRIDQHFERVYDDFETITEENL